MGTKHPDQISASEWRRGAETVLDMFRKRWDIIACCRHCRVMMRVDLRVIAVYKGRDFVLWNKHASCKVLHCPGVVDFQFRAPNMTRHKALAAPDELPYHPRGHVERAFYEEQQRQAREAQAKRIAQGDSDT